MIRDRMDSVDWEQAEAARPAAETGSQRAAPSARKRRLLGRAVGTAFIVIAAASGFAALRTITATGAESADHQTPVPTATPAAVAIVEERDIAIWSEFSGRLEAVERVEIRSRVAGAVEA